MEEQKLRQLFKNRSNCYVDTDDVVQGMDEDCFVETVNEVLRLHDVSGLLPLCKHEFEVKDQYWSSCMHCGKIVPNGNDY